MTKEELKLNLLLMDFKPSIVAQAYIQDGIDIHLYSSTGVSIRINDVYLEQSLNYSYQEAFDKINELLTK